MKKINIVIIVNKIIVIIVIIVNKINIKLKKL